MALRVGVGKGPHTSECTSSKGFVVHLTATLMNLCLRLAWMQTVHIESSCVYLTIRHFMAVGLPCVSRRCYILDSKIMRSFRVDIVLAAIGAFDDSIVGSIVGSVILTLVLSLFLFFPFSAVDKSVVDGTMIYMPLIRIHARVQEDGEVMEHFPS